MADAIPNWMKVWAPPPGQADRAVEGLIPGVGHGYHTQSCSECSYQGCAAVFLDLCEAATGSWSNGSETVLRS